MKKTKLKPEIALTHLMDLCSRGEKSPFEIEKKLKQWGLEDNIDSILKELIQNDFINLQRFSSSFTHDKFKFNKWGKIKIRFYLKGHRIEDTIISNSLEEIDTEAYKEMICTELERKKGTIKTDDPYKLKAKLFAFGSQRGYEAELMNQYLDSLPE